MADQGQRDDMISNLINKIVDWAEKHPTVYKNPEGAVMQALRSFIVDNKIDTEDKPCYGKGWSYPMAHCQPPLGESATGHKCDGCALLMLMKKEDSK